MALSEKTSRRLLVSGAVAAFVAAGAVLIVVCRRADITDPAELEKAPIDFLREREIETLISAAFRNATKVTIQSEVPVVDPNVNLGKNPKTDPMGRSLTLIDRDAIDGLAVSFRARDANEPLPPMYAPYPGVEYVWVTFEGPYRPDFTFAGGCRLLVFGKGSMMVGTPFVRKIAQLLDLEEYVRHE
jgi:hypothetical protein